MDDRFEQFVRENREEFDVREPDPRLWTEVEKRTRITRRRFTWQRVAVVALIFAASYGVNETIHRMRDNAVPVQPAAEAPLKETEAYYTQLVNQRMEELKPIIAGCPSLAEELNYDMTELDSVYTDLKNDLKDNMANQEVIEAIIENYRLKIRILEDLLTEIKPMKDECLSNDKEVAL
jgi:hypothetical protein